MPTDPHDRHADLCDWLRANGIDPDRVPTDSDLWIEGPAEAGALLHFEQFDVDGNGRLVLDERHHRAARREYSVPLTVGPSDWWQSYRKPTREQLIVIVAAVSKLHVCNANSGTCEHCSERDYPDYAVRWPCPTMQAVGFLGVQPVPEILRAARWRQTDTGGCLTYDDALTREEAAALRQAAQDYFDAGGDPRLLGTEPEEKA